MLKFYTYDKRNLGLYENVENTQQSKDAGGNKTQEKLMKYVKKITNKLLIGIH